MRSVDDILLDRDPFQLNQILQILKNTFGAENVNPRDVMPSVQHKLVHIFSAIQVVRLNIIGKVTGPPIVDLLLGMMREKEPFVVYLFYKFEGTGGRLSFTTKRTAEGWAAVRLLLELHSNEVARQAESTCRKSGFKPLKLKEGVFNRKLETVTNFALRKTLGSDVPLQIDPNGGWKIRTAMEIGCKLKSIIECLEDPVRGEANMPSLRNGMNIPLATNVFTVSFAEIPNSILLNSKAIILSNYYLWGGLCASMDPASICQTFGGDLTMHSNRHLGSSVVVIVHLGAPLPKLKYDLDTPYPWQSEKVIVGGRLIIVDGAVHVLINPGLGVEIDREAMAELYQNYLRCSRTAENHEAEMQKMRWGQV